MDKRNWRWLLLGRLRGNPSRIVMWGGLCLAALAGSVPWLACGLERSEPVLVGPERLDFGDLRVGERARLYTILTNIGGAPVRVEVGTLAAPFGAEADPIDLAPGASRPVLVHFEPERAGTSGATLALRSPAFRDGVREIPIAGAAHDPPRIRIDPLRLDFGAVQTERVALAELTIRNEGGEPLRVGPLPSRHPFRPRSGSIVVPPDEWRRVVIRFEPDRVRDWRHTRSIRSNDPERHRVFVDLEGRGVAEAPRAEIVLEPSALAVGGGEECGPAWLSIRNPGSDPLQIASVGVPRGFTAPRRSRRVPAGGSIALPVSAALRSGFEGGALTLYTNAPSVGKRTLDVSLRRDGCASGDAPPARLASETLRELDPRPGALLAGEIRLASFSSRIEPQHLARVAYDPESGRLALENLELPAVEAALGQHFDFESTRAEGLLDALGDADLSLPLTMRDGSGRKTALELSLTTRDASAVVGRGVQIASTGEPLDETGVLRLVGTHRFGPRTAFFGRALRIRLDVRIGTAPPAGPVATVATRPREDAEAIQ